MTTRPALLTAELDQARRDLDRDLTEASSALWALARRVAIGAIAAFSLVFAYRAVRVVLRPEWG
jgi:hypothetical protein